MAKDRTSGPRIKSYLSLESDLTTVPPRKPGEDYQIVPRSKADSIYQERMLRPDYLKKVRSGQVEKIYKEKKGQASEDKETGANTKKPAATSKKRAAASRNNNKSSQYNVDTSVVDFLKSIGEDSSYAARKRRASEMGLNDYTGTAEQNTAMLRSLKSSPTKKEPTTPRIEPSGVEPKTRDDYYIEDGDGIALNEKDLLDQNMGIVKESALQDGSWERYKKFLMNLKKQSTSEMDTYPTYEEYMAYRDAL